eukprot:5210584-Prymnesium_polylepis.1
MGSGLWVAAWEGDRSGAGRMRLRMDGRRGVENVLIWGRVRVVARRCVVCTSDHFVRNTLRDPQVWGELYRW